MPNKNYLAGYRAELRAKYMLIEEGYTVMRAAKSGGPFDLIAFSKTDIRAVQVKLRSKVGPVVSKAVFEEIKAVPVPDNVSREIWTKERMGDFTIVKV